MKRIFILSLLILIVLIGCSNDDAYNNSIQKGLDYIASEEYEKAESAFELALDEKPDDEKTKAILEQTTGYQESLKALEEEEYDNAKENAEKVIGIENGSSALIKKSEEVLEYIKESKDNNAEKEIVDKQAKEEQEKTKGSEKSDSNQEKKNENILAKYSDDEIEYARVWLQVIDNQATEELNVYFIREGELVNPYSDSNIGFPEDLISLGGGIMADGNVTYSSNGDGSINIYHVPSHYPTPEDIERAGQTQDEFSEEIINDTETVYIDPGDDDIVEKMIKKINIYH